ncbi:hypothetical protein BKA66DRAFT_533036 [Pyrenochaeta sp. MPI-SDFR-AT-0127]|nr:hypothetical protein BKA66DRAFT_533036 [Pyrenochaeta sp. MPI-SDFR-AT-0127]
MTLAGRKRKFGSISTCREGETEPEKQQQPQPKKQQQPKPRIAKKRATKKTTLREVLNDHPAATFKTPSNPQATLEGLPAELRLLIYDYLCDSAIIHVHRHCGFGSKGTRFTWTPCRSQNSTYPLLCANPKWSGMCDEEERCTYKIYAPPEPRGFWALGASNKWIRSEAQEFFLRRTVISIHPHELRYWLDHLDKHNPDQPAQIHSLWRWVSSSARGDPVVNREAWKTWFVSDWVRLFDSSITVTIESMVWCKPRLRWGPDINEQQIAIRVLREGKKGEEGESDGGSVQPVYTDADVKVDIDQPGRLASAKRTAKWRQWWRGKDVKRFA